MTEQDRNQQGKFLTKGETIRAVRSIRLTDAAWETLGDKAEEQAISRADYLEALTAGEVEWEAEDDRTSGMEFDPEEVADILKDALTLKANAGGKIKARIREALEIMGFDPEGD